ncbi:MAG: hypothetical protein J6Q65_07620, partial [Lentisphaeria bacterium]|nr:hypothetical protein [Lentisphaeria bacterium]
MEEILQEMKQHNGTGQLLSLKIIALVSKAMTKLDAGDILTVPCDRVMDDLCAKLKSNPGNDWSIKNLSERAKMSANQFLRKFHDATGTS